MASLRLEMVPLGPIEVAPRPWVWLPIDGNKKHWYRCQLSSPPMVVMPIGNTTHGLPSQLAPGTMVKVPIGGRENDINYEQLK